MQLEKTIILDQNEHSKLALWPLFVEDWRQSIFGPTAISNILNYNLFESAIKCLPRQRIGIFLQENQGWEFGFIQAWREGNQGQLIGCPHSSVRFWDLRYFFDRRNYEKSKNNRLPIPDKIALNGNVTEEAYVNGGYPSTDLVQVEALRYLYLQDVGEQKKANTIEHRGELRLLVLGEYSPSNTHLQMLLLEKAFKTLPTGIVITIKPHPACPIQLEDYPHLQAKVVMEPIDKLLPECDVAYCSAVTSAAVDAYCIGVPVISVLDPSALNLSPLRGFGNVFFVTSPEELSKALASVPSIILAPKRNKYYFTIDKNLPRWRKLLCTVG
jgi:surface carbohydrate biosynthesis protein (TIGR04326 family)